MVPGGYRKTLLPTKEMMFSVKPCHWWIKRTFKKPKDVSHQNTMQWKERPYIFWLQKIVSFSKKKKKGFTWKGIYPETLNWWGTGWLLTQALERSPLLHYYSWLWKAASYNTTFHWRTLDHLFVIIQPFQSETASVEKLLIFLTLKISVICLTIEWDLFL